jgi:microcystin-dependent protein
MNYSTNYNLNKPERSEQFNIDHWNNNTDAIDTQMHTNAVNIAQNATNIATLFTGLNTKNTSDTNSVFYKLMKLIYPVGSLYWSANSTNPSTLFGGTWVQIKDRFVLACGDTYKTVGATGGASSVTLSVNNMPSHTHSFTPSGKVSSHSHGLNNHTHSFSGSGTTGGMSGNATGDFESVIRSVITVASNNTNPAIWKNNGNDGNASYVSGCFSIGADKFSQYGINNDPPWRPEHCGTMPPANRGCLHINVSHTHSFSYSGTTGGASGNTGNATPTFAGDAGTTGSNGSGTSFSILPPYVVKYCWERVS